MSAAPTVVKKVIAVVVYPTGYDVLGFPRRFKKGLFMFPYVLDVLEFLTERGLSRVLTGTGVPFEVHSFNLQLARDANEFRILEELLVTRDPAVKVILAMAGVMGYQLPFSIDVMCRWKKMGAVCFIGGPIINDGLTEMLDGVPEGSPHNGKIKDELKLTQQKGFTLFRGDAYPQNPENESVWEGALRDSIAGKQKSLYNGGWAPLQTAPIPPWRRHDGYLMDVISIDQQTGCPFFEKGQGCNFCAIGSLSGKKQRERLTEQILRYLDKTFAICSRRTQLFPLGDNGARSENSRLFLEGLIALQKRHKFLLSIQVDTQAHNIPGFVDTCEKAGVAWVFVGVETPNPEGLKILGKKQNRPKEYRKFCDAMWNAEINPLGSIMIGQNHHTPKIALNEVDKLCEAGFTPLFTVLTPSPGSPMHSTLRNADRALSFGEMNTADSSSVIADHPVMSRIELQEVYWAAWRRAYIFRYQFRRLRRTISWSRWFLNWNMEIGFWRAGREQVHPLLTGFSRVFSFWDRKPESLPLSWLEYCTLKVKTRFSETWLNIRTLTYAAFLAAMTIPLFRHGIKKLK